jgi:putative oxidoreductase
MHEIYLPYADFALLGLRLMLAAIFGTSGWSHLSNPVARSKSIGMSKPFTIFLGVAEVLGAAGVAIGVLASWASLGLILVMCGAIYKKAVVWKTGFWGQGSQGWRYDLVMIVMNSVVLTVGPGKFVLFH